MNNKYKILVIEDEQNIRRFIEALLSPEYKVIPASSGNEGLCLFSSYKPDVVILDLGLPDIDGMEVLKSIRKSDVTPVLVLSARGEETDKVDALDAGANDYVTKPVGSGELKARIRSIIRFSRNSAEEGKLPGGKFISDELIIDYDARKVIFEGKEIKLTQTEYNILTLLSAHFGKVLTYKTIINEIWGETDYGSTKKLQVNVANIRKKLSLNPWENRCISNEPGVGYRMHND